MVIVQISEGDMEGKSFPLSCKNVTTLLKKHISYSQQNLNDLLSTMILLATSDDIINLCITSFKLTQYGYLVYPENRGTQRGLKEAQALHIFWINKKLCIQETKKSDQRKVCARCA